MNSFVRSGLALLACGLLGASALAQGTQQVCYTDSIALTPTNWSSNVSIPKFDPSLGTLQQIDFQLTGRVFGAARAESLDNAPTQVNTQFSATMTLTRPDTSVIVITIPIANFTDNFTAYDGTLDFAGTSGTTHNGIDQTAMNTATSPPPVSDLALFTGAGNIVLPITAVGSSIATGSGNLITQFTTSAEAHVQVCYTYLVNVPPVFTSPTCGTTYMATANVPFTIDVCAADPKGADVVTLNAVTLPAGATTTPATPTSGNPVCVTVNWTPTLGQLGTSQFCFTATDSHNRSTTCCFSVLVAECYQLLGRGGSTGSSLVIGTTPFFTHLDSVRTYYPVTMTDRPHFRVPMLTSGQVSFSIQTLMHNPQVFPTNPDQWSQRLRVTVQPGGVVNGELLDSFNGIHQSLAVFTNPVGGLYMTFPFTIDGM